MGQYWKLINIDKKELIHEVFDDIQRFLRYPSLRRVPVSQAALARTSVKSRGIFVKLPQELIDAIVQQISFNEDIICFALTSTYYWRLFQPLVRLAIIKSSTPWAGDRIVHIGEYAASVPPRCPDFVSIQSFNTVPHLRDDKEAALRNPLYALVDDDAPPAHCSDCPTLITLSDYVRPEDLMLYIRLLKSLMRAWAERGQDVLRNLTTMEYVLAESVSRTSARNYGVYDLGDIVVMFTRWSEDSSFPRHEAGRHSRWAGCRFDIIDEADFEDKEGWRNVSDDMVGVDGEESSDGNGCDAIRRHIL
ncbi:hypothetical protein LTR95_009230 [Oleoguttula sp. CCFEE 5521]